MSSVPHIGGVIVTSLNQIGDIAKGELRAWLEPWFETRGGAVTLGSGSNQAAAGDDPRLNAGVELAYAQITANWTATATSEATATTIVTAPAVTLDGATTVIVEFAADAIIAPAAAGAFVVLTLFDGSTVVGQNALALNPAAGAMYVPARTARRLTPSAGSHTYSMRNWVSGGTGGGSAGAGGAGADSPAFIRVTRV